MNNKIKILVTPGTGQILLDFQVTWSRLCEKNLDYMRKRLRDLTSGDEINYTEGDRIADIILELSNELDQLRDMADQLKEQGIQPSPEGSPILKLPTDEQKN